jgi:uncharacterized protein YciI
MVLAWDGAGEEAVARRDAWRAAHMESITALFQQGRVVLGAGILDDDGVVRGSLVVTDYPDRADVDGYLASEPFQTEGVWDRVEVYPLRLPEMYLRR